MLHVGNDYYVYLYLDPRKRGPYTYGEFSFDYEPFYIGKGRGRRYLDHLKEDATTNAVKVRIINKLIECTAYGPIIKIFQDDMYENDAFELEKNMIKIIGRRLLKSGPLVNLTDGGEGSAGAIRTKEMKDSISGPNHWMNKLSPKKREMWIDVHFRGPNNPMYGKGERVSGENHWMNKMSKDERESWINNNLTREHHPRYGKVGMVGKNNPMYGKNHSLETIKKIKDKLSKIDKTKNINAVSEKNSKLWKLINGKGEEFIIGKLGDFCKKHNLSYGSLLHVAAGRNKQHRGWNCYKLEEL